MQFRVQLFYDGVPVDPSEISSLIIVSPTVHRIVNRVIQRCEGVQSIQNSENEDAQISRAYSQDVARV